MKIKKCSRCKKNKSINNFGIYKSGINKGYYLSQCKQCNLISNSEYRQEYPWLRTMYKINERCGDKTRNAYKDIKNFLTNDNLKYIWFRDKAYFMKRPSIDRIDATKNYTLENCRYVELSENISTREWIATNGKILKNLNYKTPEQKRKELYGNK